MPKNIIVTCGTSQIEPGKFNIIDDYVENGRELRDAFTNVWEYAVGLDENELPETLFTEAINGEKEPGKHCRNLVAILCKQLRIIDQKIGTVRNPFGAEMSTLHKMHEECEIDPTNDKIKLLYSDTQKGAFAAAVLHNLLIEAFKINSDNIGKTCIKELREYPRSAEEAEENTQSKLLAALEDGLENIFVMTGGFKSIIPILTVCAIIKDVSVYYLFEQSKELQIFSLPEVIGRGGLLTNIRKKFGQDGTDIYEIEIKIKKSTDSTPLCEDKP